MQAKWLINSCATRGHNDTDYYTLTYHFKSDGGYEEMRFNQLLHYATGSQRPKNIMPRLQGLKCQVDIEIACLTGT
jgi:hypothetical protein